MVTDNPPRMPACKLFAHDEAAVWRDRLTGSVVFTNGVFDLIHPGHIDILMGARRLGDYLIVGVNSDASVKRLKGPERPIRSESDRAYVIAGMESVDAVVIFDEDTPLQLIKLLRPDILVKGGDYSIDTVVGAEEVIGWGGQVRIMPFTAGQSTTSIVNRLKATKE